VTDPTNPFRSKLDGSKKRGGCKKFFFCSVNIDPGVPISIAWARRDFVPNVYVNALEWGCGHRGYIL